MITYRVSAHDTETHHDAEGEIETMDEAFAYEHGNELYERFGNAMIITWAVHRNLPHAWPPLRHSSCALRVRNDGDSEFHGVNIHG